MQSYRIYFTVAGGNMRPLFIGARFKKYIKRWSMFMLGLIVVFIVSGFFWKMIAEDKQDEEEKRMYDREIKRIDRLGEDIKREIDKTDKELDDLRRERETGS